MAGDFVGVANYQDASERETTKAVKLPLETLPATGDTLAKVCDGFPFDGDFMLQSFDAVIAGLEGSGFGWKVAENKRCLLAGVCDDGGEVIHSFPLSLCFAGRRDITPFI